MTKPASEIEVKIFHHTLIWPLIMHCPTIDAELDTSIEPFVDALKVNGQWVEPSQDETKIHDDFTYEEIVYFHPFVRDFLFGDGSTPVDKRSLRRLKRTDVKSVTIGDLLVANVTTIDFRVKFRVERTELLLVRPRIAILLIEISNRIPYDDLTTEQQKVEREEHQGLPNSTSPRTSLNLSQVLFLQSRLRHIYPPYLDRTNMNQHGEAMASVVWERLSTPGEFALKSDWKAFDLFTRIGSEPPVYAHWKAFFGDKILPMGSPNPNDIKLFLQQLIDDRMPAMSYIGVADPEQIHQDDQDRLPAFDAPNLGYQNEFKGQLRSSFRYDRFRHWKTTYYCNGTSFAVVTDLGSFSDKLLAHFRRHYTHIAVIAQFQHAALLYFADELADAAKKLAGRDDTVEFDDEKWAKRVRKIQYRFMKFLSRSYFLEVSNQIQGKDLFKFWLRHLATEELLGRVSATNQQVFEALENHEAKQLTLSQERLAKVAVKLTLSQERLAKVAGLGLGISIFISTIAAVFAWAALYPEDNRKEMILSGNVITGPLTWGLVAFWMGLIPVTILGFALWLFFRKNWLSKSND